MTLFDKAKVAAEKAAARAQQGMQQGQAKLDAIQTKRRADALLRELGAAYYAEQRHDGGHEPVERALAALDAHTVEHGTVDTTADPSDDGSGPGEGPDQ
ncbi:MAG: hypothetical protein QOJ62_1213 [Actinomycetota bacterium]|jgi:hypothetical protein|nr:hypothetical protein [Actinomycetota bacterium]